MDIIELSKLNDRTKQKWSETCSVEEYDKFYP